MDSNHDPASNAQVVSIESQHQNDANQSTIAEDSNNNTSLVDREQSSDRPTAESSNHQSPAVREIHKNSWLKKMPSTDKWTGKFPKSQKIEKFWVVFCVHDDREAFLEFYENRRSAYSHIPISSVSLSCCLHISPTIVAQGSDHEFVITLQTEVIRLATNTNEQMLEWMDTLNTKLRELGVLEPKDNLYTKEPFMSKPLNSASNESQSREDFSRLSLRDPNSPLPPVPGSSGTAAARTAAARQSASHRMSTQSLGTVVVNVHSSSDPLPVNRATAETVQTVFSFEGPAERPASWSSSQGSLSPAPSPNEAVQRAPEPSSEPTPDDQYVYEPLFTGAAPSVPASFRNPSYENPPPHPTRHIVFKPTPALPPRHTDAAPSALPPREPRSRHSSSRNLASAASDPSLNIQSTSSVGHRTGGMRLMRANSQLDGVDADRTSHGERLTHSGARLQSNNSAFTNGTIPMDENGRPISLRESQVLKLQSEIGHKSGVRLFLRRKDCVNAIAFVECFNAVWIAGWKQKEHPLLHNTFHIGDKLVSIAGLRIHTAQDAHRSIKQQACIVEFIVRRVPHGKILAIKREAEGQDLGIIREGGTAEIKEVKSRGLASSQGLPPKSPSMDSNSLCNWTLTEINHRPLNLFFKDHEVHDRLNAVGLDISLLVQPVDLIKALKKQLKTIRGYKDYLVQ